MNGTNQTNLFSEEEEQSLSVSMSLPAGSRNHVRISPLQETKREWVKAHGRASGQSAPVLLGRFDPDTQSLKTSQHSFLEQTGNGLSEFSGTYPRSGMMRNGTVYQLPTLAQSTKETESGYLPTPGASDNKNRGDVSNPSIQRRIRIGKQVGLSMLFKRTPCLSCVTGIMGFPKNWLRLD